MQLCALTVLPDVNLGYSLDDSDCFEKAEDTAKNIFKICYHDIFSFVKSTL